MNMGQQCSGSGRQDNHTPFSGLSMPGNYFKKHGRLRFFTCAPFVVFLCRCRSNARRLYQVRFHYPWRATYASDCDSCKGVGRRLFVVAVCVHLRIYSCRYAHRALEQMDTRLEFQGQFRDCRERSAFKSGRCGHETGDKQRLVDRQFLVLDHEWKFPLCLWALSARVSSSFDWPGFDGQIGAA